MLAMVLVFLIEAAGPGTEIHHDCGYWSAPEGQPGRKWVALPKTLVLIGWSGLLGFSPTNDGRLYLLFVEKGTERGPTQGFLLTARQFAAAKKVRYKPGQRLDNYPGDDGNLSFNPMDYGLKPDK